MHGEASSFYRYTFENFNFTMLCIRNKSQNAHTVNIPYIDPIFRLGSSILAIWFSIHSLHYACSLDFFNRTLFAWYTLKLCNLCSVTRSVTFIRSLSMIIAIKHDFPFARSRERCWKPRPKAWRGGHEPCLIKAPSPYKLLRLAMTTRELPC